MIAETLKRRKREQFARFYALLWEVKSKPTKSQTEELIDLSDKLNIDPDQVETYLSTIRQYREEKAVAEHATVKQAAYEKSKVVLKEFVERRDNVTKLLKAEEIEVSNQKRKATIGWTNTQAAEKNIATLKRRFPDLFEGVRN